MNGRAYYNDSDPFVAQWLRNLAKAGRIPPGYVDGRKIQHVEAGDLRGAQHVHWFAGIGGWPLALALAGWPDDRPVWTASCPCQPFSQTGKRRGFADHRHLWPYLRDLVAECRPPTIFGEQVADRAGLEWLDVVLADLESEGYAVAAADLCAASVGAPHRRQRLWFAAHRFGDRREGSLGAGTASGATGRGCSESELANVQSGGRRAGDQARSEGKRLHTRRGCGQGRVVGLADNDEGRRQEQPTARLYAHGQPGHDAARRGAADHWDAAEWIPCSDGRARPVEPGTFPLANGVPGRVGLLRAYGNAIVPQVAAVFVRAAVEKIFGDY